MMMHAEPTASGPESFALRIEHVRYRYPASRGRSNRSARQAGQIDQGSRPPHAAATRDAVAGVSLTIPAGQTVAMLGPNGSGKSTIMRIICGLLPPTEGTIEVFGSSRLDDIRRALGVVFQRVSLDRYMTVWENLRDQAMLQGVPRNEVRNLVEADLRAAGLIDRADHLVKTLSGGLARRVDLARAMLHRPRVLMLDEPTVGLDPAAREQFLEHLFRESRKRGTTVLMSTHLVDEADRHDRVILMHQGQVIADDAPDALRRQAGARQVTVLDAGWTPPPNAGFHRTSIGWTLQLQHDGEQATTLAAELAKSGVAFSIAPPTLADVFEQLTGARLDLDADAPAAAAQSHLDAEAASQ